MIKIALYGALFSMIPLHAQTAADQTETLVDQVREAGTRMQVLSGQMINGRFLKGEPFSADAVEESVQVLADGNRIVHSNSTRIYRDSQGRERRETLFDASGAPRSILISDPVAGANYNLRPDTKVAIKTFGPRLLSEPKKPAPTIKADLDAIIKAEVPTVMMQSTGGATMVVPDSFFTNGAAKVEPLGKQMILGVSAEGTRRTTTIPAGQIGNEQPIVTVADRWVSPELQVLVMSTRTDPRSGTFTYKLTNLNRGEPSPTLFQVPPDYTVQDYTGGRASKPEERE